MEKSIIKYVFLCVFTFSACGAQGQNDATTLRTCEPIHVELCRGLGYNSTGMPNFIGHELQSDADFTLQTFSPLIQYGCSAQLHFFLCSVYVPMCTEKVPAPIGPCRGLCESVRARCFPVLQGFGFPWPAALDCQRFPRENNHEHMCMEGPGEGGSAPPLRVPNNVQTISSPCQRLAKPHLYAFLNRSNRCAPLCKADILFDAHDKHLAEVWSVSWSALCFAATLSALLTFAISPRGALHTQVLWPLCLCYCVQALGWAVRALAGSGAVACGPDAQAPGQSLLLSDGLSNANCAVVFLLLYYFGMAAAVWYAILCWCWYRSVGRNPLALVGPAHPPCGTLTAGALGTRDPTRCGTVLQVLAWGLPAMQTVVVLVARLVDADELTGTCSVGNQSTRALLLLVACPLTLYLVVGLCFLVAGVVPVTAPPGGRLNRLAWCAVAYAVPSTVIVVSYFYEYFQRDDWLAAPRPSPEPLVQPRAPVWVFLLRIFMSLICGVVVSVWALTPDALESWKRLFGGVGPSYRPAALKCPAPTLTSHYYAPTKTPSKQSLPRQHRIVKHHVPAVHTHRKPRAASYNIGAGGETVL